jgi:AmiR/NasT family two-component response regulator
VPGGPRVPLIDDGEHHGSPVRSALTRQGHVVVAVVDPALAIHDCVLQVAIARLGQDRGRPDRLRAVQILLSERKVIERAKGILTDEVGMSVEQAHRTRRKSAAASFRRATARRW